MGLSNQLSRRLWLWTAGLCVLCAITRGQDEAPSEYAVKAAFLYNFTKFVEWPARAFGDANSPLVIGILGSDPFGDELDRTVGTRTANGRKVVVRRFNQLADARGSHVLFISASERRRFREILAELADAPILTVSEAEGFCEAGGMINFNLLNNRVRFDVNPDAANNADLKPSAKLLNVAARITRRKA